MRPLKLFITAFGPYAGTEVVDFRRAVDAGLFGIYGPTGSGKSSIFSALAFALFGEGAKHEQSTGSMRSDHAPALLLTEVALIFELGPKRYFVRRQPDQKRPKLRGEGETDHVHTAYLFDVTDLEIDDISIDNCGTVLAEKRVGPVNDRVRELLGYDIDQFRQIVLLPQGQFERFLASDSKARLEILRGLFDVSLYQRMTERLRDQALEARTNYQQGMLLQAQQLKNAGFDSTDNLAAAIEAAEGQCLILDAAATSAETARTIAGAALANGMALKKKFDDALAATSAYSTLQARQPGMDILRERHRAAGRAAQLVDRYEAIARTVASLGDAKVAEVAAAKRAGDAVKAEADALAMLAGLKAKSDEIDGLKQRVADLNRYDTLLSDAADLKLAAEGAEATQASARKAASSASLKAEEAASKLAVYRKSAELAQGVENERTQLTTQRDRVQHKLQYACDVERAQSQLTIAEENLGKADQRVSHARIQRRDLESVVRESQARFISGQARLLAESLAHGSPCPVCGSVDHPEPAHGGEPASGLEALWREAQSLLDGASEEAQSAESAYSSALSIRDERKHALDALETLDASSAELDAELAELDEELEALGEVVDLVALTAGTHNLEAGVVTANAERDATAETERSADKLAALARQSYNDHIAVVPEGLRDEAAISIYRRDIAHQIGQREEEVETAQAACTQASASRAEAESDRKGAAKRIIELERALADASDAYSSRRDELGVTEEQYQSARPDIAIMASMLEQLEEFGESLARARGRVDETSAAIADQDLPDLDFLNSAGGEAQTAALLANQAAANARAHCNQLGQLLANLQEQMAYLARLNDESGPLRALADAFEGRNSMSTTLETYAVGAMFDQVLEAANLRFEPMSQGRYRLERDIQTVSGRKKRGLDIRVHDIQTGRPREVSTLSGGETFIAALSLALGLSDIVEMSHGAIRLDTIFIDEGFGSLDSDGEGGTLDQVLQVLQDIVGQRRAVGLISHVPLVQQAVPNGFTVIKTPSGSTIVERIV